MSTLFEQFLAGEDGISALLRALPAYAPPAGMDAWFVQAARAASVAHAAPAAGATQAQAGSAPVIRAAGAQTFDFEPPASLQAAFSAAAAQADQTQASQRQAVQRQLAHGGDAVQAVGAPLSAQARAWIDAQQHVELAERPTAFVRSVSSRGDVPSDSEPYTGTAAPAALSDLAEATSARRLEINSNNKTDSDSDSDSDSENRTRHVSLRRYIRSAGLFEHEHLSPGVSNHVWLLSTSPTRRMQIKPTVSAGESPSGALRHSIVRLDPRVTAELIS